MIFFPLSKARCLVPHDGGGTPGTAPARSGGCRCLAISASGHSSAFTCCKCTAPTFTNNLLFLLLGRMISGQQPRKTIRRRSGQRRRRERNDAPSGDIAGSKAERARTTTRRAIMSRPLSFFTSATRQRRRRHRQGNMRSDAGDVRSGLSFSTSSTTFCHRSSNRDFHNPNFLQTLSFKPMGQWPRCWHFFQQRPIRGGGVNKHVAINKSYFIALT